MMALQSFKKKLINAYFCLEICRIVIDVVVVPNELQSYTLQLYTESLYLHSSTCTTYMRFGNYTTVITLEWSINLLLSLYNYII